LATRRIRVEAAGGTLAVVSTPASGTTVTVSVPLD
jgi:signal transduction histidine kinase